MEGKERISEYRNKLAKTLRSPELANNERVRTLVKNQILRSSSFQSEEWTESLVERRSKEVSNFLGMLRSASINDAELSKSSEDSQGAWKVKEDAEEYRVMYREGAVGTPFHTLLVEGFVDGPVDICLCVSYESNLYNKWWPQSVIPTFKVMSSQCLNRIGTGEQISLVRMKLSWPMSSREVIVHYFAFEYFEEGLIVVLINSVSDSETIDRSTHGFTRDGIPNAHDVVRIDVVGGFAIQKVTPNRSFFRTIANMDIKLDFIPPSLINFISRQLIGSGFKLFKKEVASVSKGDKSFTAALKDSLYTNIRQVLYSEPENLKPSALMALEENKTEENDAEEVVSKRENLSEIEEVLVEETYLDLPSNGNINVSNETTACKTEVVLKTEVEQVDSGTTHAPEPRKMVDISSEVEQALSTLEKAISFIRNHSIYPHYETNNLVLNSVKEEESMSPEIEKIIRENENTSELSKMETTEFSSNDARNSSSDGESNSHLRETNQWKITPTTQDEEISGASKTMVTNIVTDQIIIEKITDSYTLEKSLKGDVTGKIKHKKKRYKFCGFCFHSWKGENY